MAYNQNPKTTNGPASGAAEHATPPTQQVWLAGLGAMAKAQEQGSKAIEALLSDGLAFQRKSQAEAQLRLQEATERLSHMATDLGQNASVRVDKLEHLFEDRVAKALHRLGMPSLVDIQMLSERVAQLESQLLALQTGQTSGAAKPRQPQPAKVTAPKATAVKKASATAALEAGSAKATSTAPSTAASTAPSKSAASDAAAPQSATPKAAAPKQPSRAAAPKAPLKAISKTASKAPSKTAQPSTPSRKKSA